MNRISCQNGHGSESNRAAAQKILITESQMSQMKMISQPWGIILKGRLTRKATQSQKQKPWFLQFSLVRSWVYFSSPWTTFKSKLNNPLLILWVLITLQLQFRRQSLPLINKHWVAVLYTASDGGGLVFTFYAFQDWDVVIFPICTRSGLNKDQE